MNDQQEEQEQEQEQEIWNDFQLLREAQKADAIEAEYNKFMDGDTETMLEIARNAWEYTPEETEDEDEETEAESAPAITPEDTPTITPAPTGKWQLMNTAGFVYPTRATPKETEDEDEDEEIEREYHLHSVTIEGSAIHADISTSNSPEGKFFVALEGGADGWCGYTDTLEDAEKMGAALIAEYLTTE